MDSAAFYSDIMSYAHRISARYPGLRKNSAKFALLEKACGDLYQITLEQERGSLTVKENKGAKGITVSMGSDLFAMDHGISHVFFTLIRRADLFRISTDGEYACVDLEFHDLWIR